MFVFAKRSILATFKIEKTQSFVVVVVVVVVVYDAVSSTFGNEPDSSQENGEENRQTEFECHFKLYGYNLSMTSQVHKMNKKQTFYFPEKIVKWCEIVIRKKNPTESMCSIAFADDTCGVKSCSLTREATDACIYQRNITTV